MGIFDKLFGKKKTTESKEENENGYNKVTYPTGFREEFYNKNGVKEGLSKRYYPTGELSDETNYKNGKEHGSHKSYYKNSQLRVETNYKDGKREGIKKEYYKNGELHKEVYFENDNFVRGKEYYPDGSIIPSDRKLGYISSQNVNGEWRIFIDDKLEDTFLPEMKQQPKEERKKEKSKKDKDKLYQRLNDYSENDFPKIEFFSIMGEELLDSFESNKKNEYYLTILYEQYGFYQLEKTKSNNSSEIISKYSDKYDPEEMNDFEDGFDETNEVFEDDFYQLMMYKVDSDNFSKLFFDKIIEYKKSNSDEGFCEWFYDDYYEFESFESPETLMNKLGLSSEDLTHVFEENLEISDKNQIKNNPYIINSGSSTGDCTVHFLIGIKN